MLKMHLKKIVLPVLLFFLPLAAMAQPGKGKEKIEAMRVAFITKRLDLTVTEAQAFWPLYNQYQQKKEDLRTSMGVLRKKAEKNYEGLSDKEIDALIEEELAIKQKELDAQKEFNKKIKSVLPVKKVGMLYKAEEDFKMELIKQLQNKPSN